MEGNLYTVVLNGKTFKINSWGNSGNDESDFGMQLETADVAAAEKLFKFMRIERKHPAYCIDGAFSTVKTVFAPGEKILVTLTIRNVGTEPFFFQLGGHNRGPRDDQFSFSENASFGTSAFPVKTAQNFGGISMIQTIKPGETFTKEVDLGGWFELNKPGYHFLIGSYLLSIYANANHETMVWEDYLTRPFWFEIREENEEKK
jgi:hypothetical protein